MQKIILLFTIIVAVLVFFLHGVLSPKARQLIRPSNFSSVQDMGFYSFKQTHPFLEQKNFVLLVSDLPEHSIKNFVEGFVNGAQKLSNKNYQSFVYATEGARYTDFPVLRSLEDIPLNLEHMVVVVSKQVFFSSLELQQKVPGYTNLVFLFNPIEFIDKENSLDLDCSFTKDLQRRLDCFSESRRRAYFAKRKKIDPSKLAAALDEYKNRHFILYYSNVDQ